MLNWLEKLAEVKELVKDFLDGMSSKDKVTACGIGAIAAIVIANINGGGDNSSEHLPDVTDDNMREDDAE